MSDPNISAGGGAAPPFPSGAALRAAHSELLKRHRELLTRHGDDGGGGFPPQFFADVEEFISRGRATGALLDADEDRWGSQGLLDYWATILYRAGRTPPDATMADFDPEQAPELGDDACPYLGLYAFQEAHQKLFFGRQRLVEGMLEWLRHNRLLAVVGPSGSGKSSAVLAGLLPALKGGQQSDGAGWSDYPPMVPGSDPLHNLALMTAPPGANVAEWVGLHRARLEADPGHLLDIVRTAGGAPALVVVDQFEELFTLCSDDALVGAFVANLLRLIEAEGPRHTVLITVRSDFEPQIARLQALYPHFQRARVQVTPLSAADLRDAIEKPAELVGLKFEPGIVDDLVKEILGEPAGLPLLQFTLLELWKRRERNRITWETYRGLGGAREALTLTADRFYNNLIPQDQATAKRILLRLARTSEGVEVLRNRVSREALYKAGEASDQVDRVLERLVAARLLRLHKGETPGDDQVEVAHEALVRNWRRLVQWLEEERAYLRERERLTAAAEQWRAHGRDPGGLLGGSLLDEAMRHEDLNPLEKEFVEASRAEVERLRLEKEQSYRREVEQAQALAAAQQRSNRRLRLFAAAVSGMLIIALASTALAIYQTRAAKAASARAKAEETKRAAQERAALLEKQQAEAAYIEEIALRERAKSELQAKEAEERQKLAEAARASAEKLRAEAERQRAIAVKALDDIKEEQRKVKEAEAREAEANKAAEAAYRSNVELAPNDVSKVLRGRVRPLRPGASVGSTDGNTSSYCCLVRDAAGTQYLLSLTFSFGAKPGAPILQPSQYDGGSPRDKVAEVTRSGDPKDYKSGALARLLPGFTYTPEVAGFGRLKGVAATVNAGDTVYLVGRGSGLVKGRVAGFEPADKGGDIRAVDFSRGGDFSSPGDGGAPVFTEDGRLVGLLWGSNGQHSLIVPIQKILDELNVELVP
jgi:energy-coupling factor transporter ATP-binding protein EcfA2